ncbi:hypothetical protein KDW07_14615 [Burkholderia dolosa]|uniref:hypothetical protein n=1 Tax=Burkholderia dolosa TaxID=152500 RepID=UPI00159150DF|nr:hypothetical protein [Burkholderia dolosa]MBR8458379.1 hypothetical protein [Burkholderia dolosa]
MLNPTNRGSGADVSTVGWPDLHRVFEARDKDRALALWNMFESAGTRGLASPAIWVQLADLSRTGDAPLLVGGRPAFDVIFNADADELVCTFAGKEAGRVTLDTLSELGEGGVELLDHLHTFSDPVGIFIALRRALEVGPSDEAERLKESVDQGGNIVLMVDDVVKLTWPGSLDDITRLAATANRAMAGAVPAHSDAAAGDEVDFGWTAIATRLSKLASAGTDSSSRPPPDEAWLRELDLACDAVRPACGASSELLLASALAKLIVDRRPFPESLETMLELLDARRPERRDTSARDDWGRADKGLIDRLQYSLGERGGEFRQRYVDLLTRRDALVSERDAATRGIALLKQGGEIAIEQLTRLLTDGAGGVRVRAERRADQLVMLLQHFYETIERDAAVPYSDAEIRNVRAIGSMLDDAHRRLLDELTSLAGRDAACFQGAGRTDVVDGHLSLLVGGVVVAVQDSVPQIEACDFLPDRLILADGAEVAYRALDISQRKALQHLARECLIAKQLVIGTARPEAAADVGRSNDLLRRFHEDSQGFRAELERRGVGLDRYVRALETVLHNLPQSADAIRGPVKEELEWTRIEHQLINEWLAANNESASGAGLRAAIEETRARAAPLEVLRKRREGEIASCLAEVNQQMYQLHTDILNANIKRTQVLTASRSKLQQDCTNLVAELRALFAVDESTPLATLLRRFPQATDTTIAVNHREAVKRLEPVEHELHRLDAEFRLSLLTLQKETQAAREADRGGFPEDTNWFHWFAAKMGDPVARMAGVERASPQSLILERHLALSGGNLRDAYVALFQLLHQAILDPSAVDKVLHELGMTPSQLTTWSAAYPELLVELSSNLNHAYCALGMVEGAGGPLRTLFSTAWANGTVESITTDILMGNRDSLSGVVEAGPLPPALIALLHAAGWVPYAAGIGNALAGRNVAGTVAGLFAGSVVGSPAANIAMTVLFGAMQTQVESSLASEIKRRRDLEVTVNAVLRGLSLDGQASLSERAKAIAAYRLRREALQEAGTVMRDFAEGDGKAVAKRYVREVRLWWSSASTGQKAALAAAAAVPSIAIGVAGVALAGPVAGAVAVSLGALGTAVGLRRLWSAIAPALGMSKIRKAVRQEMTRYRLQVALDTAGAGLGDDRPRYVIGADAVSVMEAGAARFATPEVVKLLDDTLRDMPDAAASQVAKRFAMELDTRKQRLHEDEILLTTPDLKEVRMLAGEAFNEDAATSCISRVQRMLSAHVEHATTVDGFSRQGAGAAAPAT